MSFDKMHAPRSLQNFKWWFWGRIKNWRTQRKTPKTKMLNKEKNSMHICGDGKQYFSTQACLEFQIVVSVEGQ